MDKNFADYIFSDTEFVDPETKEPNTDLLKTFNDDTLSNNARGRLFIGSVRMVQKRTEPEICKRGSILIRLYNKKKEKRKKMSKEEYQ